MPSGKIAPKMPVMPSAESAHEAGEDLEDDMPGQRMLPNRRRPRPTGRDRKEMTSIAEMKGRMAIGTPCGANSRTSRDRGA